MNRSLVTETPDELLMNAERDIITVQVLLSKKFYPEDMMYIPICFHATQAVEKLLKSYIINNGKKIEKTHNLNYLCKSATEIDISFETIKNDCVLLNDFVPGIKYGDDEPIVKQEMDNLIKSLNNVCDFSPIKSLRDLFKQKHQFEIID
ncbi:MAG: HEPN domain-containing protein [Treponema sp.]|jgi:HEPN domain-containing protein|nr:HEPN domain-containing protein [Treponema sp.]